MKNDSAVKEVLAEVEAEKELYAVKLSDVAAREIALERSESDFKLQMEQERAEFQELQEKAVKELNERERVLREQEDANNHTMKQNSNFRKKLQDREDANEELMNLGRIYKAEQLNNNVSSTDTPGKRLPKALGD
jgi:hypothetical protein